MGLNRSLEQLARWWTSASKEERFRLFRESIHGAPEAPPLEVVRLAIFIAESEAGEIDQG